MDSEDNSSFMESTRIGPIFERSRNATWSISPILSQESDPQEASDYNNNQSESSSESQTSSSSGWQPPDSASSSSSTSSSSHYPLTSPSPSRNSLASVSSSAEAISNSDSSYSPGTTTCEESLSEEETPKRQPRKKKSFYLFAPEKRLPQGTPYMVAGHCLRPRRTWADAYPGLFYDDDEVEEEVVQDRPRRRRSIVDVVRPLRAMPVDLYRQPPRAPRDSGVGTTAFTTRNVTQDTSNESSEDTSRAEY